VISAVTGWTYTEILQQHYTSSGLGHDQHECTHRNCFSVTTVLLFYPVVSFPFSPLLFFPFLSFPYFTKLALFCFYTVPTLFLHHHRRLVSSAFWSSVSLFQIFARGREKEWDYILATGIREGTKYHTQEYQGGKVAYKSMNYHEQHTLYPSIK
jgi:hypothetical protein